MVRVQSLKLLFGGAGLERKLNQISCLNGLLMMIKLNLCMCGIEWCVVSVQYLH